MLDDLCHAWLLVELSSDAHLMILLSLTPLRAVVLCGYVFFPGDDCLDFSFFIPFFFVVTCLKSDWFKSLFGLYVPSLS